MNNTTAVFRSGAIGDIIQISPVLSLYKSAFPDKKINLICGASCKEAAEACRSADSIWLFDDRKIYHGTTADKISETVKILKEMRKSSECYMLNTALRWQIIPHLALINSIFKLKKSSPNRIDNYMKLFGLDTDKWQAEFYPSEIRITPPEKPYIAIAPGGAINIQQEDTSRRWGYFTELVIMLADTGQKVVLIGSSHDSPDIKHTGIYNLCGKTSLSDVFHIIKNADVFAGIDSGLLHLAEAAGTKTIGIFTSTDPDEILHKNSAVKSLVNPDLSEVYELLKKDGGT